jgi:hypothetical protein
VVHSYSKWLNQALIITTDAAALIKINQLPFVKAAAPVAERANIISSPGNKFDVEVNSIVEQPLIRNKVASDLLDYGSSTAQVKIHEGEFLHNSGFMGQGITIAYA